MLNHILSSSADRLVLSKVRDTLSRSEEVLDKALTVLLNKAESAENVKTLSDKLLDAVIQLRKLRNSEDFTKEKLTAHYNRLMEVNWQEVISFVHKADIKTKLFLEDTVNSLISEKNELLESLKPIFTSFKSRVEKTFRGVKIGTASKAVLRSSSMKVAAVKAAAKVHPLTRLLSVAVPFIEEQDKKDKVRKEKGIRFSRLYEKASKAASKSAKGLERKSFLVSALVLTASVSLFALAYKKRNFLKDKMLERIEEWKNKTINEVRKTWNNFKTAVHAAVAKRVNTLLDKFMPESFTWRLDVPKEHNAPLEKKEKVKEPPPLLKRPEKKERKPNLLAAFKAGMYKASKSVALGQPISLMEGAHNLFSNKSHLRKAEAATGTVGLVEHSRVLKNIANPFGAAFSVVTGFFGDNKTAIKTGLQQTSKESRLALTSNVRFGFGDKLRNLSNSIASFSRTLGSRTPTMQDDGGADYAIDDGSRGGSYGSSGYDPTGGKARVTSKFGMRIHPIHKRRKMHTGIDFAAPTGTPVFSPLGGKVFEAGINGGMKRGYGKTVKVLHGNGLMTLYAHLSAFNVKKGQYIKAGQKVGAVGSTGGSTGPHLHYETRLYGKPVNPVSIKYSKYGEYVEKGTDYDYTERAKANIKQHAESAKKTIKEVKAKVGNKAAAVKEKVVSSAKSVSSKIDSAVEDGKETLTSAQKTMSEFLAQMFPSNKGDFGSVSNVSSEPVKEAEALPRDPIIKEDDLKFKTPSYNPVKAKTQVLSVSLPPVDKDAKLAMESPDDVGFLNIPILRYIG